MVAEKTNAAYKALLAQLEMANASIAPRALQTELLKEGFSRFDIQRAIQLALSNGAVRLDSALRFEATAQQAA